MTKHRKNRAYIGLFIALLIGILTALNIGNKDDKKDPLSGSNALSFKQLELKGSDIFSGQSLDKSLFQGKKLTTVHVWATFCQPCIEEMPQISQLAKEVSPDVQIIGFVVDTLEGSMDNIREAQSILEKAQADFVNVSPAEDFLQSHYQDFSAVPMTFFVDQEGKQVGPVHFGSASLSTYEKLIEKAREQVSNDAP